MTGRFEEAVSAFKKASNAPDDMFAHLGLTGTYSLMGGRKKPKQSCGSS